MGSSPSDFFGSLANVVSGGGNQSTGGGGSGGGFQPAQSGSFSDPAFTAPISMANIPPDFGRQDQQDQQQQQQPPQQPQQPVEQQQPPDQRTEPAGPKWFEAPIQPQQPPPQQPVPGVQPTPTGMPEGQGPQYFQQPPSQPTVAQAPLPQEQGPPGGQGDQTPPEDRQAAPPQQRGGGGGRQPDITPAPVGVPPGENWSRTPDSPLQALLSMLLGVPTALMQGLAGAVNQVGPDYGRQGGYPPYGQPGYRPPDRTQRMLQGASRVISGEPRGPGWAGQAVRQGYDRAAAEEAQRPPSQGRPPEAHSKGPNVPDTNTNAPEGTEGGNTNPNARDFYQRRGIQPDPSAITSVQTPYGPVNVNKAAA